MSNGHSYANVEDCCRQYAQGQLDPNDRQDVIAQLRVEGHKRLEAFLFEPLASRAVAACLGPENTATGWSFQVDNRNEPQYWFKLLHKTGEGRWNACDRKVLEFLAGAGCDVVLVKYDATTRSFRASRYLRAEGKWTTEAALADILKDLLGVSRPKTSPLNYKTITRSYQDNAIHFISELFADGELFILSISRLFVNCYLYPWFARQPMDVDACCVVNSRLKMIEFKRKYPASDGSFGIDDLPHGILIDWLSSKQMSLTHLLLCDPLWDANTPATHLLESGSLTVSHALWLGAELTQQNTATASNQMHHTYGAKSGFTGGNRSQRRLSLEMFRLLGRGLQPRTLCEYLLNGESGLEIVNAAMLTQARDAARGARLTR